MIYLDSSAVLKLLFEESESNVLAAWLGERPSIATVSSELTKLEVIRAARRLDPDIVPVSRALVAQLDFLPLRRDVIDEAVEVGEPTLRSLDAIHLASALSIRTELTTFLAYDHRLVAAAHSAGLHVSQPGAASER